MIFSYYLGPQNFFFFNFCYEIFPDDQLVYENNINITQDNFTKWLIYIYIYISHMVLLLYGFHLQFFKISYLSNK